MSDLSAFLDKTEQFERLVLLAQQCAPAFFAILFALVIPVFGQRWLLASLEAKIDDPGQRSLQDVQMLRPDVRAATALVRQRDHPVDVRKRIQYSRCPEVLGHGYRCR